MVSRFQRRGAPPEVTFFVFQDILTSMIGILIIVTLALALQADESGDAAETGRNERALSEKLEQTLTEVLGLKAKFETFGTIKGTAPSVTAIEAEESSLRRQIAIYGQSNEQREKTVQKLGSRTIDPDLAGDIRGMKALVDRNTADRNSLKALEEEKKRRLAEAEEAVRAAEAAVLAEKNRQNVLRLIPELSGTTKEPVLVEVDREGFKITRFDTQGAVAQGSVLDFPQGLKQLKAADQFIVFYFKPSAAHQFMDYLKRAKSQGFEVGYDLMGEGTRLEFNKR